MPWYSWYVIFVYVVVMIKRGISTERFENIRYYIRNFIEFNTFQKYSPNSKLFTNTYFMSVAAVFQKLQS